MQEISKQELDLQKVVRSQEELDKAAKIQKITKVLRLILVYTFLIALAFIMIFPFYWMINSSLKSMDEYYLTKPTFFPNEIHFENYANAWAQAPFGRYMINTLIVGVVSTILSLFITIFSAFAFARLEFKGRDALFSVLLSTMMIPGEMFTVTNFVTVSKFGWLDTYTVLIVPFLVSIFYIFLLRNNFKQIPDTLYKAAKVDGTSEVGFLVKVMIPLTAPTLISITLLKFIGTWNSYIWPRLVNKKESWRLISNWMQTGFTDPKGQLGVAFSESMSTLKMAAACMVSLPLFVLFIFFRKYIMRGVSRSGTKG